MNEADSPSINLDELRLVPDWLKEEALPPSKQYASHDGRSDERGYMGERRGVGGNRPGYGAPRGGGSGGGAARGPGGGQRDQRGGPRDQRGGGSRDRGPQGSSRGGGRFGRDDRRDGPPDQQPLAPVTAAPVKIEFLPDERCLANIVKQIRSTHMAYPLFGTARMFLQEPDRHLLRIILEPAAAETGTLLYQLDENGPVALDRAVLERIAFEAMKDRYYVEQTIPKDPPKGNFTNVARSRLSGTVLGPTNYHGYQPALRALYESRFSRRMPFEEFRQSIEVVSDPALVEQWKQEASSATTISTREGEPPTVLQSLADARVHFRQHYLDTLLRSGTSLQLPGSVARGLPEAGMMMAIRQSNENELRYPAQFVQHLRKGLQDAGLHIFKHTKRIVYVAVTRPVPFTGGAVSSNVAAILEYIGQKPLCTRKDLAKKFLPQMTQAAPPTVPAQETVPVEADVALATESAAPVEAENTAAAEQTPAEALATDPQAKAKAALAADLRFLVQAGHIIEFHNGTFDLPLSARIKEETAGRSLPKPNPLFTGERKGKQTKPQPAVSPSPVGPGSNEASESLAQPGPEALTPEVQSDDATEMASFASEESMEPSVMEVEPAAAESHQIDAPSAEQPEQSVTTPLPENQDAVEAFPIYDETGLLDTPPVVEEGSGKEQSEQSTENVASNPATVEGAKHDPASGHQPDHDHSAA